MENILPIVFLRQVDIIQEEREVFQHPLGQVHVYRGPHQEAHMEHSLPHSSSALNLETSRLFKVFNPRASDQPTVLSVFLWTSFIGVVSNHFCQQVRILKLEVESRLTEAYHLRELFPGATVTITQAGQMYAVDPLPLVCHKK